MPHEDSGEELLAVIELAGGVKPSDSLARELMQFARESMAHHKAPTSMRLSEALPRAATGKLNKRDVRESFLAGGYVEV